MMMNLYGAEHHMLVLSTAIHAEKHKHTFLQLTIALEEEFEAYIEEEQIRGSGIIINSNVDHKLIGHGQLLLLLLIDSTSELAGGFEGYLAGRQYQQLEPSLIQAICELVKEEYGVIKDSSSYLTFLERLFSLLGVVYNKPKVVDKRIKKLLKLLTACTDYEHSINSYARQLGLSNSRLSHLFKENTGIALSSYMLLHKLQKAMYLILNGVTITDAAMQAGFDSSSHLAATSKKLLGMTAKDIRHDSVFLKVSCLP